MMGTRERKNPVSGRIQNRVQVVFLIYLIWILYHNSLPEKLEKDGIFLFDYYLKDKNLSWKAKGILGYILSNWNLMPGTYRFTTNDILENSKDGRDAVVSGLKELEQAKEIMRLEGRDESGRFLGTFYIVHQDARFFLGGDHNE